MGRQNFLTFKISVRPRSVCAKKKSQTSAPPWGRAAAVRSGHRSDTKRARTQPSGNGLTKTIWQANYSSDLKRVTKSSRNRSVRKPSYNKRMTPLADPLPPVDVLYQSVSQMRPKGMNNGNEGAEFGPTLQNVKGDIVTSDQAFTKWGVHKCLGRSNLES